MFIEGNGFFGTWLYTHLGSLLRTGAKRPIQEGDFPEIAECDLPQTVSENTKQILDTKLDKLKESNDAQKKTFFNFGPSKSSLQLWKVILQVHKKILIPPVICKLFGDLINYIPIICMNQLLQSLSYEEMVLLFTYD